MNAGDLSVRAAAADDVPAISHLWFVGWRDGHGGILSEELARARTLQSFQERLAAALSTTWVGELNDKLVGFYMLKGDELYQFYVAREGRGAGVAASLISDAERRLAAMGVTTAWLACAVGNERAARFYEKSGWRRASTFVSRLNTTRGAFDVEVWRYEKRLKV